MKKLTTKEDISDLLYASTPSIALSAAIETGLFEMLAERPMDGEEVSRFMNIPGKRGYYWLQMLMELGILEVESQGYVPSSLTRTVILDAKDFNKLSMKHNAADLRERLAGVCNLAAGDLHRGRLRGVRRGPLRRHAHAFGAAIDVPATGRLSQGLQCM